MSHPQKKKNENNDEIKRNIKWSKKKNKLHYDISNIKVKKLECEVKVKKRKKEHFR